MYLEDITKWNIDQRITRFQLAVDLLSDTEVTVKSLNAKYDTNNNQITRIMNMICSEVNPEFMRRRGKLCITEVRNYFSIFLPLIKKELVSLEEQEKQLVKERDHREVNSGVGLITKLKPICIPATEEASVSENKIVDIDADIFVNLEPKLKVKLFKFAVSFFITPSIPLYKYSPIISTFALFNPLEALNVVCRVVNPSWFLKQNPEYVVNTDNLVSSERLRNNRDAFLTNIENELAIMESGLSILDKIFYERINMESKLDIWNTDRKNHFFRIVLELLTDHFSPTSYYENKNMMSSDDFKELVNVVCYRVNPLYFKVSDIIKDPVDVDKLRTDSHQFIELIRIELRHMEEQLPQNKQAAIEEELVSNMRNLFTPFMQIQNELMSIQDIIKLNRILTTSSYITNVIRKIVNVEEGKFIANSPLTSNGKSNWVAPMSTAGTSPASAPMTSVERQQQLNEGHPLPMMQQPQSKARFTSEQLDQADAKIMELMAILFPEK